MLSNNLEVSCELYFFCILLFTVPCLDGGIRIGTGLSDRIGVVEVCMNSSWGTICSRSWSPSEASVICRQLGHSPHGLWKVIMFVVYNYVHLSFRCLFTF